jgi:hypothetical protein
MFRAAIALLLFLIPAAVGSTAWAADYAPVPTEPLLGTTPRLLSPTGPVYSQGMPSPQRGPMQGQPGSVSHQGRSVRQAPSSTGWSGYGFGGVPTYQWGYFGARYRPIKVYHRGYYGHQMSFGYRRGY